MNHELKAVEQEIDRLLDVIVERTKTHGTYDLEVMKAVHVMMDMKHLVWRLRSATNAEILNNNAA